MTEEAKLSLQDIHVNVDSAILSTYHISSLEDILEICSFKKSLANKTGQFKYTKINLANAAKVSERAYSVKTNRSYLSLLNAAGIQSVDDMARFSPEHLLSNLLDINLKQKIINKLPSLSQIYDWIRQAIVWQEVLVY
jgi:hypothetical protein